MRDGDGAICHRIKLVQAAGLKAAGHEQHVRAGRDAVRNRHVEADPAAALRVPRALHLPAQVKGGLIPACRAKKGLHSTNHRSAAKNVALVGMASHFDHLYESI